MYARAALVALILGQARQAAATDDSEANAVPDSASDSVPDSVPDSEAHGRADR